MCIDGGFYSVVPADIDPGGGFCVSLDRDFAGETNMECMLYLRKKARKNKGATATTHAKDSATGQTGRVAALDESGKKEAPCVAALAPSKVCAVREEGEETPKEKIFGSESFTTWIDVIITTLRVVLHINKVHRTPPGLQVCCLTHAARTPLFGSPSLGATGRMFVLSRASSA